MHVISQAPVTKYMVASEMSQVEHWVIEKFKHEDQYHFDLPFSFSYGEQPSHQLLKIGICNVIPNNLMNTGLKTN